MRALIRPSAIAWGAAACIAIPALAPAARAASPELEARYQFSFEDSREPLALTRADANDLPPGTQALSNTIGVSAQGLAKGLDGTAAIKLSRPDYSASPLTDRRGSTYEPESSLEAQADVTATYAHSLVTSTLGAFGHVTPSPYSILGASLESGVSLAEGSTWIFADGTYFAQDRPSDFYINSEFRTVERPRKVHGHEIGASVEQFLTERWKARARLSTSRRVEERPRNWGVELIQGYALSDRFFSRLELKRFFEPDGQRLLDERGHFSATQARAELTWEPTYDFYVSASYTLTAETEKDPRTGRSLQVGTDQYGLGASYALRQASFGAQGAYAVTNAASSFVRFTGEIKWKL